MLKLSTSKLIDVYAHITKELLVSREFEAAKATLRSTLAGKLMKQQQPKRYQALESLLSVGEADPSEVFASTTQAAERSRIADSLALDVSTAPPSQLLSLVGQALKWQQHVGVLPPGGRFDVFRGVAPRLRQLVDKPAVASAGKLRLGGAHALAVTFTPDGSRLVTGNNEGFVEVWDALTRKLDTRLPYQVAGEGDAPAMLMHTAGVMAVAVSRDGEVMASGTTAGEVKVWAVDTGTCLRTFPSAQEGAVTSLAFSADCSHLLSSGTDGTARIHGLRSGATLREFRGHTSFVNAAFFHAEERQVVTASADGSVCVWDAKSAAQLRSFKPPQESATEDAPVLTVAPMPGAPDRLLVASRSRDVHVMGVDGSLQQTYRAMRSGGEGATAGVVVAATASPRGQFIYVLTDAKQVVVLDSATGEEEGRVTVAKGQPLGLAHHPTTNLLATFSGDDQVRLWGTVE